MVDKNKLKKVRKKDEWVYEGYWRIRKVDNEHYDVVNEDDHFVARGTTLNSAVENLELVKSQAMNPIAGGVCG